LICIAEPYNRLMRSPNPPLGGLSVDDFMRRHWQRAPLLVRGAFPGFRSPIAPEEVFALAGRDDVESRLITAFSSRWKLRHGPFEPDDLPSRGKRAWTLLVQGVDTLHDDARDLIERFRFVADARLDDLMISFATDGGGVGPHLDSYDVFLLQAHGTRRWRIAPPPEDRTLAPDRPVRQLARFDHTEEWLLEPGDMLYLPPDWAHDGVAVGDCMTFSIGFRAPSRHELLRAFLGDCADEAPHGPDPRYSDAGTPPTRRPGELPAPMHAALSHWLLDWRPTRAQVDTFIGRYVTEPKQSVWFEPPARRLSDDAFATCLAQASMVADRRTRMTYRGAQFFVNGESLRFEAGMRAPLTRFANARRLPSGALASTPIDSPLFCALRAWWDFGWIHFEKAVPPPRGRTRPPAP
jgi:50S ribosomal protein L16 3-hydroxylase